MHGVRPQVSFLFQWLEQDFLGYLKEWEESVEGREGFSAAEKAMMLLSRETIEGLNITGTSSIYSGAPLEWTQWFVL